MDDDQGGSPNLVLWLCGCFFVIYVLGSSLWKSFWQVRSLEKQIAARDALPVVPALPLPLPLPNPNLRQCTVEEWDEVDLLRNQRKLLEIFTANKRREGERYEKEAQVKQGRVNDLRRELDELERKVDNFDPTTQDRNIQELAKKQAENLKLTDTNKTLTKTNKELALNNKGLAIGHANLKKKYNDLKLGKGINPDDIRVPEKEFKLAKSMVAVVDNCAEYYTRTMRRFGMWSANRYADARDIENVFKEQLTKLLYTQEDMIELEDKIHKSAKLIPDIKWSHKVDFEEFLAKIKTRIATLEKEKQDIYVANLPLFKDTPTEVLVPVYDTTDLSFNRFKVYQFACQELSRRIVQAGGQLPDEEIPIDWVHTTQPSNATDYFESVNHQVLLQLGRRVAQLWDCLGLDNNQATAPFGDTGKTWLQVLADMNNHLGEGLREQRLTKNCPTNYASQNSLMNLTSVAKESYRILNKQEPGHDFNLEKHIRDLHEISMKHIECSKEPQFARQVVAAQPIVVAQPVAAAPAVVAAPPVVNVQPAVVSTANTTAVTTDASNNTSSQSAATAQSLVDATGIGHIKFLRAHADLFTKFQKQAKILHGISTVEGLKIGWTGVNWTLTLAELLNVNKATFENDLEPAFHASYHVTLFMGEIFGALWEYVKHSAKMVGKTGSDADNNQREALFQEFQAFKTSEGGFNTYNREFPSQAYLQSMSTRNIKALPSSSRTTGSAMASSVAQPAVFGGATNNSVFTPQAAYVPQAPTAFTPQAPATFAPQAPASLAPQTPANTFNPPAYVFPARKNKFSGALAGMIAPPNPNLFMGAATSANVPSANAPSGSGSASNSAQSTAQRLQEYASRSKRN